MAHRSLRISKCRQNNLKNISLEIPKNQIVVITGISGSGKSSLAFDTIFAEAQRRYLEYLSPQARAWMKQMSKPDVDHIEGLSPPLAISQNRNKLNPQSTVATYTDIYDFFCILFTNIGEQYSPKTGKRLIRYTRQEMVEKILQDYPLGTRLQLLAPIHLKKTQESLSQAIERLQKTGFIRLKIGGKDFDPETELIKEGQNSLGLEVIVDRIQMKEEIRDRLSGSLETALELSGGILKVQEGRNGSFRYFTEIYVCPETSVFFPALEVADFNFRSPRGACPTCFGKGGKETVLNKNSDSVTWTRCPQCQGAKLKPESLACRIQSKNLYELCDLSVDELLEELQSWKFSGKEAAVAGEILPEVTSRLKILKKVGLGYLQLNREAITLSGGEIQRVQLTSQVGAKLSGVLYIFDEPSLGLHKQDIQHLIWVITQLRDLENSVLIVEHDRSFITAAQHIIEIGPGSGKHGGQVIFQGSYKNLLKDKQALTARWLQGIDKLPKPKRKNKAQHWLKVKKASCHNLNNFDLHIPLGMLVGFCGVSGSGKSTLLLDILAPQLKHWLKEKKLSSILEGYEEIQRLDVASQYVTTPSSRSTPATYVDVMTPLRKLFASIRLARARGYSPARFSLNKKGGRCEACEGQGQTRISLQLMPDIFLPCDVCNGERYHYETLQVTWEGHTIADVLNFTIAEAFQLFKHIPDISQKLQFMQELGLDYLILGQSFTTLSGGEIQRLKLVADLTRCSQAHTLYILDEPSSGLHFHDIKKLLKILHSLVEAGHSVFIIEHNLEILSQADWLIELGPGGGPQGGKLIFEGPPQKMKTSHTPTAKAFQEEKLLSFIFPSTKEI